MNTSFDGGAACGCAVASPTGFLLSLVLLIIMFLQVYRIKVAKVRLEEQDAKLKLAQNGEVETDNVKSLEINVLNIPY